ncbi:MAG: hypothetical protein OXD46_00090 [Chloroflexi bacterium]|nr:hypothetical protein [Chloroflexota bacterium]
MPTIIRAIHCDRALCKSCRTYEWNKAINEAGLGMMFEGSEPDPDFAKWDEIDVAMGIRTREAVQEISRWNMDYCFAYPRLIVELITDAEREVAERSGAVMTSEGDGLYSFEWKIPECGLLEGEYKFNITVVPWETLKNDAVKYAGNDSSEQCDDLLRKMKNTARHRYSDYDDFRTSRESLGQPLTDDGVKAIRSAIDEEIERIYPRLKLRN